MFAISPPERIESSVARRCGALTLSDPDLKLTASTFSKISLGKSEQSFFKLSEKALLTKIATIALGILDLRGSVLRSDPIGVNIISAKCFVFSA